MPSVRSIVGVLATVLAAAGIWFGASDRGDSNGPRYVLWKFGLLPFDSSVVYPAMVGDRRRDELVLGLSALELERRFERMRTRAESTAEYQRHYGERHFLDQEILWLGDSQWLVVLNEGRVKALHLMKG